MSAPVSTARPHRGLVVAAVLFVVVVVGTGAAQLLSQWAHGSFEQTTTLVPHAARFALDSDAGNIALLPSADDNVHVRTVVRYGLREPTLVEESTPTGVRLDARCDGLLATRCDFDYVVELPPSFEVVVGGTAGDVSASGLTGPITVHRSAGDITLSEVTGPIDATSTTGEISGMRLRSEVVRAETVSGDVRLELLAAPRAVEVNATSGAIDIAVPGQVAYRVDAQTSSGAESIRVPVDLGAQPTIIVDGGTGDVLIRPTP